MNYGKEILNQLTYGSNKMKVWSWGAHGFKTFSHEFFQEIPNKGGLIFKVRGRYHGGHVMVRLKGNDTYHVSFGTYKKGQFYPRKGYPVYDGCYCDNFVDLIDEVVETEGVSK